MCYISTRCDPGSEQSRGGWCWGVSECTQAGVLAPGAAAGASGAVLLPDLPERTSEL